MHIETIRIDRRFQGPPRSGNGGYASACVARNLAGAATVRLKAPPPLDTPLRLETGDAEARLYHGELLLGEARATDLDLAVPPPPSLEQAAQAARSYAGFRTHLFPRCFVCGPARRDGDGLRIFTGPLAGTASVAAPWLPDASLAGPDGVVRREFLWAALDCPGAFAIEPPSAGCGHVVGEMSASIDGEIHSGEPCIVVAWPLGGERKRQRAGAAIYSADGALIARGVTVWFEVPLSRWQ